MIMELGWEVERSPIRDYAAWEAHVRDVARKVSGYEFIKDKNYDLVWDIWNEPDQPDKMFWRGTEAEYLEMFGRGAKALREVLGPQVKISGPCLTKYDVPYITRFLNFCKAEKITLDVLSWHELGVDSDIPSVTEHLRDARRRFVDNPAYRNLGIQRIQINESVGPSAKYMPAEILAYLNALERGGADGACRACWGDSRGVNTCYNATLDGILTPDSHQPLAAWRAYKVYAESVSSRVQSTASNPRIVSFGSRGNDERASAQIVVGYFALGNSPAAVDIVLRLLNVRSIPSLNRTAIARVRVERIPDAGEQPLPELERLAEMTLPVHNGAVEVRLGKIGLHEASIVTLTADR